MPSEYTPDSTASQPPSPAPSLDDAVEMLLNIPTNGDNFNASAWMQAFKTLGDWTTFLKKALAPYRGVRLWNNSTEYTAGMLVVYPGDSRIYRARTTNTNVTPPTHTGTWAQCDFTDYEIQALAAQVSQGIADITVSKSASVASSNMMAFANGGFKVIFMVVQAVPYNDIVDVDMSASSTKFDSVCTGAICSLVSDGYSYGGVVGYNAGADKNNFRIWAKKPWGGPATTCSVGVLLWGT